jgi:IS4 transposase
MLPDTVLDRFIEQCPPAVMVRATLENLLPPERLDQIFSDHAERQYEKRILFSQVVAVMSAVATRTQASVHASYLAHCDELGVSVSAVYDKLKCLEPGVTAAMVRETAADAARVIDAMPRGRKSVLPGLNFFFLDGNHLAATEHRVAELRTTREGPLPGQTLALLDAQRELVLELVPCEDGHAQERSLLPELLKFLKKEMVVIADRNFCTTKFLFGLHRGGMYFLIRQHASTLIWQTVGRRRRIGRIKTGVVYEQGIELRDGKGEGAETLRVRRITVVLDTPTESGETEIHLLTNLSAEQASARAVAEAYRARWTIEGMFQKLTDVLRCEVETLGYPKAALFSFAVAVLAWNTYAVVKAALRSAHGQEVIDEKLSDYHLTKHVVSIQVGMDIAVEPEEWEKYQGLTPKQLAAELVRLAKRVDLKRYPKKKRGPKKPQPRKKSGSRNHHISTARTLAASRKNQP